MHVMLNEIDKVQHRLQLIDEDPRIKEVVAVIEADSFADHALWQDYNETTVIAYYDADGKAVLVKRPPRYPGIKWEQDNSGYSMVIGYVTSMTGERLPVNLSIRFAKLNGRRVMFYYICSRAADYNLVELYLKVNFPNRDVVVRTDANNFHVAVHHINRHPKKEQ